MAISSSSGRWLNRFAWFSVAATILLICSGGMVTSKGVGLAVPDWPTTFGYNMFLFPISKWIGGVLFEHTHRLIASAVGLLTLVLAFWLWQIEARRWLRMLGLVAVGAVILQGVLGGLRVTMLKDQIGIFHACLAQAFLGLLVFIALATSPAWSGFVGSASDPRKLRFLALTTTVLVYLQLALGATMRHQHRDLAITDFPTAYGRWLPDTSASAIATINSHRDKLALSDVTAGQVWLQMAHRFGALLVAIGVIAFLIAIAREKASWLRNLAVIWLIAVCCQITLGAWTIWSNKAADVATAHVALGAITLALGVVITAFSFRLTEQQSRFDFIPVRPSRLPV